MNEGREIYLKTYSAVDKIDQMLKEWQLDYISWKWWYAPMRHGKAIGCARRILCIVSVQRVAVIGCGK